MMNFIVTVLQGFCMAAADSVPGVSGGTIAFILGFYDRFIFSLDGLISGNPSEKRAAASFLAKLLCGWVAGFGASVLILNTVFESHIYELCSLFLGFTVFSLPLLIYEESEAFKGGRKYLIFTLIGAAAVVLISYLNFAYQGSFFIDVRNLSFGKAVYVFVTAVFAVSAMVLPGISGSTLLLIFGMYLPVMSAIKEVMTLNLQNLPMLIIFGLGVLTGLTAAIKIVKIGFERFRPQVMYLITGLIIGSIYSISLGPTTLNHSSAALSPSTLSTLWLIAGAAVPAALQLLKRALRK